MKSHFPFLFINRLKVRLHRTDELICEAICSLSHFINQITSLRKWMLNDYKSTAQNRAGPKVAIMVITYIYE